MREQGTALLLDVLCVSGMLQVGSDGNYSIPTRVAKWLHPNSESYVGDLNVGGFYGAPFMPGYTLVDVFSSYKFDNGLELGATVTNLFDVDYTPFLSTPIVAFPISPTSPSRRNWVRISRRPNA